MTHIYLDRNILHGAIQICAETNGLERRLHTF